MEEDIKKIQKQTMVRVLKNYLEDKGYEVKLEPNTKLYAGFTADVEANLKKESLCFEVVNGKEIDTPDVRKKWEAISGNRDCEFCLFVPADKEQKVKELLANWGVYFRKLWVYDPESI